VPSNEIEDDKKAAFYLIGLYIFFNEGGFRGTMRRVFVPFAG
jgi:hypothetical protein